MIEFRNKVYKGSDNRLSLFDCVIPAAAKGVIVFIHGYKGFKDWGAWELVQDHFVRAGFGFVKFNMSHNGGTVSDPVDFPDLDAFGRNTYTKEVYDLGVMVSETHRMISQELPAGIPLYLLGHSRGGGIAVLYAARDARVSKVVSLAGISDIGSRFPAGEELEDWRADGVRYVENARTGQHMPHYFSLYEDYVENAEKLDIEKAARSLKVPFLQIHGDMDTSVSISEGQNLTEWTDTNLAIIKGADHTFGASHPWRSTALPEDLLRAVTAATRFLDGQPVDENEED